MLRSGSRGSMVLSLQALLNGIGGSAFPTLAVDGIFGVLTDQRVREFQASPPQVLAADGIVGPLTLNKLLTAILAPHRGDLPVLSRPMFGPIQPFGDLADSSKLSLASEPAPSASKAIIISETAQDALNWAKQVKAAWEPFGRVVDFITMNNVETVESASQKIELAASMAGKGGSVWLSVGHGVPKNVDPRGPNDEGLYDLAPSGFRVVGNNAFSQVTSGKAHVSVFYDVRPKASGGIVIKSDKENDEERAKSDNATVASAAKKRLQNFNRFVKLGQNLRSSGITGLFLVTCRVAQATGFMKKSRDFLVPLLAYRRRVSIQVVKSQRTRFFLEGDDEPGKGTNIPMGEILPPLVGTRKNDLIFFP